MIKNDLHFWDKETWPQPIYQFLKITVYNSTKSLKF